MTTELLLESLDRHFLAGCGFLDAMQMDSHKRRGACHECEARAALQAEHDSAAGRVRETAGVL